MCFNFFYGKSYPKEKRKMSFKFRFSFISFNIIINQTIIKSYFEGYLQDLSQCIIKRLPLY